MIVGKAASLGKLAVCEVQVLRSNPEVDFVGEFGCMAAMPLDRQKGSDEDWLQHSNDELARMLKARAWRIRWLRCVNFVLLLLLAWVVYKFTRKAPLEELWRF